MIVITGASDGLGLQLAKLYKEAGRTVVNISRRSSEFADINIELSLREGPEIKKAADKVNELEEELEAIIYCAGVTSQERLGDIQETEIKRLMSTNVKSQILLTSYLVDRINKDRTDIVCVSSTAGTIGRGDIIAYTASKWAVRGVAKSLQEEFLHTSNRVISFLPGQMNTKIFRNYNGKEPEDIDDRMSVDAMAQFMKQILDLPKNMEVSEVIINRKTVK